ncbi:MAG TPA: GNAT family N-acetyltransferase [Bacteroidales bacterium]|nr:GNAT family N-acetyltransferase [Bacteroidales bacterium]
MSQDIHMKFEVVPVTKDNWDLFENLFGKKGASGNCWCMYYRTTSTEFKDGIKGDRNKNSMKKIISDGKPAGLLGLLNGEPVAWCAFAPREHFIRLERSRYHKRIDNEAVWSIPCFFIGKNHRHKGLSNLLLKGAIEYAKDHGIKIIEAYPLVPAHKPVPETSAWYGIFTTFQQAGFKVVNPVPENRPMVRYYI